MSLSGLESGFFARETPFAGLGQNVEGAKNSIEALSRGGLDWEVYKGSRTTVYGRNGPIDVPEMVGVIRESDNTVLGMVSPRYCPIQNREAFEFTDELLGKGERLNVQYQSAGSTQKGKRVWIVATVEPPIKVNGDKIAPYLIFVNSHDASTKVRVALIMNRILCNNAITFALQNAVRSWGTIHMGNLQSKLRDAAKTLELTEAYLEHFPEKVEEMMAKNLYKDEVTSFVEGIFPERDDMGDVARANMSYLRDLLIKTHTRTPDISRFKDSAWAWYNATSDMVSHMEPVRKTKNYRENLFMKITEGHPILERAQVLLEKVRA